MMCPTSDRKGTSGQEAERRINQWAKAGQVLVIKPKVIWKLVIARIRHLKVTHLYRLIQIHLQEGKRVGERLASNRGGGIEFCREARMRIWVMLGLTLNSLDRTTWRHQIYQNKMNMKIKSTENRCLMLKKQIITSQTSALSSLKWIQTAMS